MIGLEGATCNTALIPEMEEIGANILLAEHIGRALVVGSEPADRLDVDVPGPLGKAGKPHVVDHTLTQRGHGRSPFGFKRQDLCPGTDQIPQHAVLNDYAFYGEAVQSNRSFLLRFSRFFRKRQWPGARHTETAAGEAVGGELRSEPNVLEMRRSQTSKVA